MTKYEVSLFGEIQLFIGNSVLNICSWFRINFVSVAEMRQRLIITMVICGLLIFHTIIW